MYGSRWKKGGFVQDIGFDALRVFEKKKPRPPVKEKLNDREQQRYLSELINTTRRALRFTCKEVFVRINTICK